MTSGTTSIVYVHDSNNHDTGGSAAWYAALTPYPVHPIEKHEVRWTDVVNARKSHAELGA